MLCNDVGAHPPVHERLIMRWGRIVSGNDRATVKQCKSKKTLDSAAGHLSSYM